jgi:hypothetical protein
MRNYPPEANDGGMHLTNQVCLAQALCSAVNPSRSADEIVIELCKYTGGVKAHFRNVNVLSLSNN